MSKLYTVKKKKEIQRSSSFTHAHMHPEDWHKDKNDIKCAFESMLFESIKANRIAKGAGWLAGCWLIAWDSHITHSFAFRWTCLNCYRDRRVPYAVRTKPRLQRRRWRPYRQRRKWQRRQWCWRWWTSHISHRRVKCAILCPHSADNGIAL